MFTLREVEIALLGGPEAGQSLALTGVCTDSRSATSGDLFFCIEGDNFDGHEFAAQAVNNGASAVVASRLLPEVEGAPIILVRDTIAALGLLAAHRRQQFLGKVVAVTGSAGKTTLKELLASALSMEMSVSKNTGNLNNQIGLPLSIFRADMSAKVWVMEAGISLPGDMDELGPIAAPDVAIIHNIGPAHLEGLGSIAGVAQAKASLLDYLADGGIGIVNRDYDQLWEAAQANCDNLIGFSTKDETADYFCSLLETTPDGMAHFKLKTPEGETKLTLAACGAHHAENIAGVAAAAHQLGLPLAGVIRGAAAQKTMKQRFVQRQFGAITLIDDTYNANPMSMNSSMQAAKDIAGKRPLVLILADMKELGEHAKDAHRKLGEEADKLGTAALFYKGEHADDVAAGFGKALVQMNTPHESVRHWRTLGLDEAVVLVKGSRSLRMEEHAGALAHEFKQEETAR